MKHLVRALVLTSLICTISPINAKAFYYKDNTEYRLKKFAVSVVEHPKKYPSKHATKVAMENKHFTDEQIDIVFDLFKGSHSYEELHSHYKEYYYEIGYVDFDKRAREFANDLLGKNPSRSSWVQKLKSSNFSNQEIEYVEEYLQPNWKLNALYCAEWEVKNLQSSKQRIKESLSYVGFTNSEIKYAIKNLNVNFVKVCETVAKDYIENHTDAVEILTTKDGKKAANHHDYITVKATLQDRLAERLVEYKFSHKEIRAALKSVQDELNKEALEYAKALYANSKGGVTFKSKTFYTEQTFKEALKEVGFSSKQIKYIMLNIGIDYEKEALQFAEEYAARNLSSVDDLVEALEDSGFQEFVDEIESTSEIDFKSNALEYAQGQLKDNPSLSRTQLRELLVGMGYSIDIIDYVMEECETNTNWKFHCNQFMFNWLRVNYGNYSIEAKEAVLVEMWDNEFLEDEVTYAISCGFWKDR